MEIVEVIKPKENVKEFLEEKLKRAIKEVNMNQNYEVIGCIPQFSLNLREFTEKIKITINTKRYDMELGSKNLSIAIGFIGKQQML